MIQKRKEVIEIKEMILEWKEKIFVQGRNKWLILLLLGLLLLVCAMPTSSDAEKEKTEVLSMWESEESSVEKSQLEAKLTEILGSVEGVGAVKVMLMTGEKKDNSFYSSGEQKVTGVLISAQGADQSMVVKNIQDAVMALFQVEAHKIKVMKMK